ncbi:nicotinate-nucleotide adenylyltransferase [Methylomarinovum caldicuralii]|uniref:Probable nicotinate-nucleotide adenylyltransferase n=1 Tax=Methylomarinovum caldicuralii TaxID=438856 RepID=A0AAU9C2T5_9GAMM|nr:nicotinate-nucleotide adenylyltransferase [Methylomarinovum caldicuralii]BCX82712.1 nicotinate-nucleotide adenylyltransferase [Methylomarinovum caldicuralii]
MIGIYGGTFDPVHYGHLRTALEVQEALGLDQVRFVPCRQPPHRRPPRFSAAERRRFLEAVLADAPPGFVLDTRELERPGPSYMIDTLDSLRAELGDVPLVLILGLDAFLGLPGWHRWQEIPQRAHLLVMDRPGYRPDWPAPLAPEVRRRCCDDPGELRRAPGGRIHFLRVTRLEISGTFIRRCLQEGKSPRYLLPDTVLRLLESTSTELA